MATEAAERRAVAVVRSQQVGAPLPPVEHHHDPLPCPRCSSSNTKFCYYNNYNFSQPRHFCKSCRRYWTHGGTLRDIPVGGASRKTPKRSRTSSSGPILGPTPINPAQPHPNPPVYLNGGFTTLLSGGGLALGGFGLGLGLEEYGLGRGVWAFPDHEVGSYVTTTTTSGGGDLNGSNNNSSGSGSNDGGGGGGGEEGGGRNDTWQVESGGGGEVVGFVPADCFASLPELAISSTLLK